MWLSLTNNKVEQKNSDIKACAVWLHLHTGQNVPNQSVFPDQDIMIAHVIEWWFKEGFWNPDNVLLLNLSVGYLNSVEFVKMD